MHALKYASSAMRLPLNLCSKVVSLHIWPYEVYQHHHRCPNRPIFRWATIRMSSDYSFETEQTYFGAFFFFYNNNADHL